MARAKSKPISPDNPQARIEEHPAFLLGKHPTEYSFLVAAPPGSGKPVGGGFLICSVIPIRLSSTIPSRIPYSVCD